MGAGAGRLVPGVNDAPAAFTAVVVEPSQIPRCLSRLAVNGLIERAGPAFGVFVSPTALDVAARAALNIILRCGGNGGNDNGRGTKRRRYG